MKPRTQKYRVLALLLRGVATDELPADISLRKFWNISYVLQNECGYIMWRKPTVHHSVCYDGRKGKPYHYVRITGRLAWTGGVAEDYTVPR